MANHDFELQKLFNYSELTKVLEWLILQSKHHDQDIRELKSGQISADSRANDMANEIKEIQEKCITFEVGLETINQIADKVSA